MRTHKRFLCRHDPDLGRLLALRVWHAMWLQRIDDKIAALQQRKAEQGRGRQRRFAEPEWFVARGIRDGRPPAEVHAGCCYAAGRRRRPVSRDEARRLLATGVRACSHCRPDTVLDILDVPIRPALAATTR
ncbi:DUF6233 domain-containing protein [Streptomyces sp. Qhu-G9]|uniref:DUF6233 domain-containing protein n=1 Tax=Streptomyces sp. Qhu-G9 TaxID=3452799 RepID=UPI0022AC15ED|nr:DUF6233 domain-containing protein [Streptomyces aurantiacus]WAU82116.1 DUF6233 domain-containing protein [Streptomyces aurantiacus]